MTDAGFSWGFLTILGPIVLAAVLLWALIRNRQSRKSDLEQTERSTELLYRAEEAHRLKDDGKP